MADQEKGNTNTDAASAAAPFGRCLPNLSSITENLTSIARTLLKSARRSPPPPLLPVSNPPPSPTTHAIMQTVQKFELGKLALTLAPTAALALLFSQKFDALAWPLHFLVTGLVAAFMILWNGTVFRTIFPRLGNILELVGISLVLLLVCGLAATFVTGGFSWACWIFGALCLLPLVYVLIVPHAAPA